MIIEDAWWMVDTGLSLRSLSEREAAVAVLCLYPHFARIVYESDRCLTRLDPSIGSKLIDQQYRPQLEAARHSTKLFDDTKRGLAGLVDWFDRATREHQDRFRGNVLARMFRNSDLAVATFDQKLVTTSLVSNLCLGANPSDLLSAGTQRELTFGSSTALGAFASGVVRAFTGATPQPTLDLANIGSVSTEAEENVLMTEYFSRRYEAEFPVGLKAALTAVESSAQTAASVLSVTGPGHEDTVFRARLIVASHLVSSLRKLLREHTQSVSKEVRELISELLQSKAAKLVVQRGTRSLRNIAMHYELTRPISGLDVNRPMSGLVEALVSTTTYDQLSAVVLMLCDEAALLLREWQPRAEESEH
jgi:hypothetical protein